MKKQMFFHKVLIIFKLSSAQVSKEQHELVENFVKLI